MSTTGISSSDVTESLKRLQRNFEGAYGPDPILEDDRIVGSIHSDEKKTYLTFRGSVNSLWEVLSCFDIRKRSLKAIGLPGSAHRGIYEAFHKTHSAVLEKLKIVGSDREIVIDGYSRGAGIATLMGAYLKKRFPERSIKVLCFSPLKIFDREASLQASFQLPPIYNFICQEDWAPSWAPSWLNFVAVGVQYTFSAAKLPNYAERVKNRTYLHLMSGCVASLVKWILPARVWEAHMPETYQEGAPSIV
jgi:hypothetical protein